MGWSGTRAGMRRIIAITVGAAVATAPLAAYAQPNSTPGPIGATGTSGTITLEATSTAPRVQFLVDGLPVLAPVDVGAGHLATLAWPSWGYPNGSHTVAAADCSTPSTCGDPSGAVMFSIRNDPPVITAPVSTSTVRGGFTIDAVSPGGAVLFRIDGIAVGADTSSPYSLPYRGTALTQGSHMIQALQCSLDMIHCAGPAAEAVGIHADVLHPRITAVSPAVFSPNDDGVRDSTRVTYSLPESQAVRVVVSNAAGTVVRSVRLGTQAAGTHYWSWNGNGDAARAADGVYTITVRTAKTINGVSVPGRTTGHVRLDTTAPGMSTITGDGVRFYPYPDGYRDTYTTRFTLSEPALLQLVIKNAAGTTVRKLHGARRAGRTAMTWDGRDAHRQLVPAGTYSWTLTAKDAAGNHRTTGRYTAVVSAKRLVWQAATITKRGNTATSVGTNLSGCVQYSTALSDFDGGLWLNNFCDPSRDGSAVIDARYTFTVPRAVRYATLAAKAYGFTMRDDLPTRIFAAYRRASGATTLSYADITTSTRALYSLGHVSAIGRVSTTGRVRVAIGVSDAHNANFSSSDFDIAYVRLRVTYYVLR
jgi:flagellar hook assembly protein FlgD